MTDKVTLNHVSSFVNDSSAVGVVNANMDAITTAMDNTLSRDGTTPNSMNASLDMNGNQILNLPSPTTMDSPVRLRDVASNPEVTIPTVGTSGATVPLLNGNNTWSGTNTYNAATSFVGAVTAPTQTSSDNSTKVATTAYVQANLTGTSSIAGLSVLGTNTSSSAVPAAVTGAANQYLGVNNAGTTLSFATMSGDATLSDGALTLATVNGSPGSVGSSTSIPSLTVNAKGLVTAASGNVVVAPAGTLSGTTLNSTVVTSTLGTVGNTLKAGADSATPATSTVVGQSVLAGTSNTPGTDLQVAGGKSTGTGVGGKVLIQTSPAGSSGSSQNSGTTKVTVDSPGNVVLGLTSARATNATDGFVYIPSVAGAPVGAPTAYGVSCPIIIDTTNHKIWVYDAVATAWKYAALT